jgi:MFS family permease
MLAALAVAEFFAMTLWFSATAVTPALVNEFHMPPDRAAWLTLAVQIGFVAGTLGSAAANLADILNARALLFVGAVAGAATNAAVLLVSTSEGAIVLRFLTGVSLACVYPPGMKLAAGWFRERRGLALGVVIGALALGNAVPHLLTAFYGRAWREPMLLASLLALLGGLLVLGVVRDGPYVAATARFDRRAILSIFRSRGARLATFGYLGHMWELYAMWTWIAVLATASFTTAGVNNASTSGSMVAFLAIASGTLGCVMAGWLADRLGRAMVAMWAMVVSAFCAALIVVVYGGSPQWFFLIAVVWGFAVVADSAQFSALVSEFAPPEHVGTALTLQTCLGFLLTMVTIEGMPRLAEAVGWRWASLLLVPGPVFGIWAMRPFLRHNLKMN